MDRRHDQDLITAIKSGEWVERLDPLDLSVVERRVLKAKRTRAAVAVTAIAATVAAIIGVTATITRGDGREQLSPPVADQAEVIPWTPSRPLPTNARPADDCRPGDVRLSAGKAGA